MAGSSGPTAGPAGEDDRPTVWLVDGFNVFHVGGLKHASKPEPGAVASDRSEASPSEDGQGGETDRQDGWWTAPQRAKVISRAKSFDDPKAELWVVFDGERPPETAGPLERIHVVFAPSADEWIRRRVRDADPQEQVVVVTADRKLAGQAGHHGARIVKPRAWLARCRERR